MTTTKSTIPKEVLHLGFEVGTGNPVEIPIRHMVVTGQSQEAGKTTTLEALISRSLLPAVAFITKRGEQSFSVGHRLQPYFRERADWQFVSSVLEATMRERLKFERAWIIRASKGAKTLADVRKNVKSLMFTAKGLSADVYLTLDSYLEIVVPRVESIQFAKTLDLKPGLNILDLSDRERFPSELQALVMRSVLEAIYEQADGTITIIPEAWEFIPQGRGSPVKLSAVELIRKGAGLRNYVWLDSQDIGGVDKELLRSCPVWLLGVQREANEISRTLDNIPAGIAKPKPADIATLERGQFFACWGKHVIKTYVQPAWLNEEDARGIATGAVQIVSQPPPKPKPIERPDTVTTTEANQLREENKQLKARVEELEHFIATMKRAAGGEILNDTVATPIASDSRPTITGPDGWYDIFKERLIKEAPALLKILVTKPELEVAVQRKTVEADETSALGMIAILLSEDFLKDTSTATAVWKEMKRRWNYGGISARAYEQLDRLTAMGFVTKENDGYKAVPGMKINIIKK